ncbi:MFS transporter [bacterium]|nr:MFS transporter [bacterium]
MDKLDFIAWALAIGGGIALVGIIWSYAKGLKSSPMDMWLMFIYNAVEYTAYASMNMALVLWLTADCGISDIGAGTYIAAWSIMLSIIAVLTGAIVDTIGIRKTLLISIIFLLISRFFMAWVTDPVFLFISGFIPLAVGFAIVGPMISVAIKRYTTKETAALGFGLFYVLMNLGYAGGGFLFDIVRGAFAIKDGAGKIINENAGVTLIGHHFSTYQMFFVIGFGLTLISLIIAYFLKGHIELNEEGDIVEIPKKDLGSGLDAIKKSAIEVGAQMKSVAIEKIFWVYLGMLSLTLFVRFVFYHFAYTFPKYGISVLGEGAKIGNIYGVLNPALIIFIVPLIAYMTKKVSSYKMLIIGSLVSAGSTFIAVIPASFFEPLTTSTLGQLIFIKWLNLGNSVADLAGANAPTPEYWPLIFFIFFFTIGEAIWSPRLMQFTAEIAPKGKEGTYIALSMLPWLLAKFFVGPMSGILIHEYTPFKDGHPLPPAADHAMVWVWIGGMALITPVALFVLGKPLLRILKVDGHEEGISSLEEAAVDEIVADE